MTRDTESVLCEHCGSEGEPKTVDYYGNDALACVDCGALL